MEKSPLFLIAFALLSFKSLSQEQYKKTDTKEIIRNGIKLNDEKKYAEAIAEFKKVPRNDSNFILASIERINTYISNDQNAEAITLCDELLKQKNDYTPNALLFKANALDNLNKNDESEKIYMRGAKDYPVNCMFLYELGVSKFKQKKYAEAQNLFIKAIKINPGYAPNHFQMGNLALIQGKYIPAMLAYQYYLISDNSSKRAYKVVDVMESLAKVELGTDSVISIPELTNEDDFSELESIFKSKVALSAKYKSKTDFGFDVTKQMQLVTENIGKYKSVKGFYNEFYGQIFSDIWSTEHFEPYVYFAFSGLDNAAIKKVVEKNKKDIDAYETWMYNYLCVKKATYPELLNGKTTDVPHWLANNKIVAAGTKNAKQNNEGYWNFYYDNGIKRSEGTFVDGKKQGPWKFYYKTGDIKEEVVYNNGEQAHYKDFYYNNNPKSEYTIKNGVVEGEVIVYYTNGKPKAILDYVNNKINGTEKQFYRNGAPKYSMKNTEGKYEGELVEYFSTSKISEKAVFVNNKREGNAKNFYNTESNSLYSEGSYKNGESVGLWKFYHKNGKVSSEGSYKEGTKDGIWKAYYETGTLSEEETYSNGKLDGVSKNYNEDGTLWEEYIYKKGKLLEYKAYKNSGEVIVSDKLNGKNYAVTLYYSNGKKRKVGNITDGELSGLWKFYNKFDVLEKEMNYEKGSLNGAYTEYFINGGKSVESYYVNGTENGYYKSYFLNGKVHSEGWVVNGEKESYWKTNYIDGTLRELNYYNAGELEGWHEYYSETGKIASEDFYELGCITQVINYDSLGNITNNTLLPGGNGILEPKYANGKVRFHREFVNDYAEGRSLTYFPNGDTESERTYKSGQLNGKRIFYNVFGKVTSDAPYFNGQLTGASINYFYDGKKKSDYTYVGGNKEGKAYVYFPNGKVSRELEYKNDVLHGSSKVFDEFGQLVYQRTYDNDLMISYSYNDATGNLLPPKKLEPGNFKVVCYFANGKKSVETNYFNGELHGKRIIYASNGKVSDEEGFEYGELHGPNKEYYANGKLKLEQNFYYGEESGPAKEYYEDGTLREEKNYRNGVLNGPAKYYDTTGKLVKTINYYYDIPLSVQ